MRVQLNTIRKKMKLISELKLPPSSTTLKKKLDFIAMVTSSPPPGLFTWIVFDSSSFVVCPGTKRPRLKFSSYGTEERYQLCKGLPCLLQLFSKDPTLYKMSKLTLDNLCIFYTQNVFVSWAKYKIITTEWRMQNNPNQRLSHNLHTIVPVLKCEFQQAEFGMSQQGSEKPLLSKFCQLHNRWKYRSLNIE